MTLAGQVFDKLDVPGSHGNLFASRYFELSVSAERNHRLTTGRRMPIAVPAAGCTMKLCSGIAYRLEDIITSAWRELSFYFFGVRLPVRSGVEVCDKQRFAFLCLRCGHQNKQTQQSRTNH